MFQQGPKQQNITSLNVVTELSFSAWLNLNKQTNRNKQINKSIKIPEASTNLTFECKMFLVFILIEV